MKIISYSFDISGVYLQKSCNCAHALTRAAYLGDGTAGSIDAMLAIKKKATRSAQQASDKNAASITTQMKATDANADSIVLLGEDLDNWL